MPQNAAIPLHSPSLKLALQEKIDQKTKPLGALGQIELLALKIGLIQNSQTPNLSEPTIIIFAGDHGIAEIGVSAYPQTVTGQMVTNFLIGGAAICVFARQHQLKLYIVDAGVKADLEFHPNLISRKMAYGTANFLYDPAMSNDICELAIQTGIKLVEQQHLAGCNCIGFGEMGIANTSSAALLVHCLTKIPLRQCIGRGTGLDDNQFRYKQKVLQQARNTHGIPDTPLDVLAIYGGFEIAMMVGAYLQAAERRMIIMVDGFITCAALLVASKINPVVLDYCVFSHVSSERGHKALLNHLNAMPLLNLELRLGEGSGIALAYPLLKSAVLFLNEMSSFTEANVDQKSKSKSKP